MNDYNRCNKVTGVHWLTKPISNLKIKIHLKKQNGISLPAFLIFNSDPNTSIKQVDDIQEFSFKWQQKVFSAWELQRYADIHNCITDTELNYHDVIKKLYLEHSKVFSYIHDDNYMPNPKNDIITPTSVDSLSFCMQRLNLNGNFGRFGRFLNVDTVSLGHLFKSEENLADEEKWMNMHLVLDNSEYNDDSQLLLKQEATLLSLYYNISHNYLIVRPDVNNLEWNPYNVETSSGAQWNYLYSVRLTFEEEDEGEELETLLKQLNKKWLKKNKSQLEFVMPPIGRRQYHLTVEIVSAADFDADDLYIEFYFKYPDGVTHNDVHHGRTHVSRFASRRRSKVWHYSHVIELSLETDCGKETASVELFLEAISCDWWGRYRTEGYSRVAVPLRAGAGGGTGGGGGGGGGAVPCVLPEESDAAAAAARRFFVGGCHLLRDLDVLTKPRMQDSNFRFVSSGSVTLRWGCVVQYQASPRPEPSAPPAASATALLQGAEAVLRQYRKARARLAAATKDLRGETSSGHLTRDSCEDS